MRSEYSGKAEWGVHFTPDMSFIILAEPAKPGQGFSFSFIVKQLATVFGDGPLYAPSLFLPSRLPSLFLALGKW